MGCAKADGMPKLSEISYVAESGTILPELQWHEEYLITREGVTFIRTGNTAATEVNSGQWVLEADGAGLAALFDTLGVVDLDAITRIEPADEPEGGGTESYTLTFKDGKVFSLYYTPGADYQNGDQIVEPVQAFLQGLSLPSDAANRYQTP